MTGEMIGRQRGRGINSGPGEGAGDEDPLAAVGPDETGRDNRTAGADADAAGRGVVGGIRAVRKHPSQLAVAPRGRAGEEEERSGDEEIGSPEQTLERGSCSWWRFYCQGDEDEEGKGGGGAAATGSL